MKTRVQVQFHELPGQIHRCWTGINRWEPRYWRICASECPGRHAEQSDYIGRSKAISTRLRDVAPRRVRGDQLGWWPDAAMFLVTLMPCYPQSKYYERQRIGDAQPIFNVPEADHVRRRTEARKRNIAAKAAS